MVQLMKKLWLDEEAANAVEYGLIAAIIAVGLIFTFQTFRGQITRMFQNTGNQVANAR
jgi:Flp pilus assembly pilin Flp